MLNVALFQSVQLPSGLTYNSRYWLELHSEAGVRVQPQRIVFSTPWCHKPDVTFTRCLSDHDDLDLDDIIAPPPNDPGDPTVLYASVGTCVFVLVVVVIIIVLLVRRNARLRDILASKMEPLWRRSLSVRQSLRGGAYSLRDRFHGRGPFGFRSSFTQRDKGGKPVRMKKRTMTDRYTGE